MYLKVSGQTRSRCKFNFRIFFYLLRVNLNEQDVWSKNISRLQI